MKYLLFLSFSIFLSCQYETPKNATEENVTDTIKTTTKELPLSKILQKTPDYDTTQWTDISYLDESIIIDLKYATTDNFVKTIMYECGRCFLRPPAAAALVEVHKELQKNGHGLKVFDCYRPRPVQYKLWEILPDKNYVANPDKGSMHNRGAAVDLTIVDAEGKELDMGTAFDFFGKEAWHEYQDLPKEVLENRKLLKESMEAHGFKAIRTEWWHYSLNGMGYPLDDMVWNCE